ncbi:MAG: terminase small subunit [Dehalobacter sp. 4CP]|uniref:terminase small subunit n=1 Tax=Dehalobacter sp. CP TaxID=2594474 RepID=UPI0013C81156|nr:terminase small subunit [Dehalobacter sp. 4CP]
MAKLTKKQQKFVEEYLIDLNATQAAIRAGYSVQTANEQGSQNLAKLSIQNQIAKTMAERSKRTGINQDRVVIELAKVAFSNISDYLKVQNNQVEVFDTASIPADAVSAIAEIKQNPTGVSIKLYDKLKALELLGRHLGIFKDKVEITANINNPFEGLSTEELKVIIQKL